MATLRLELDIDSDVYPELYAKLLPILTAGGRSERVRQLAASGLVWEMLRIEGNAPPIVRRPAGMQPSTQPAVPPGTAGGPAASRASSKRSSEPRFVDLAIDAPPAPPSLDGVAPGDLHRATEAVGAQLPVLTDVLEPALATPVREDAGSDDPSPPEMRHTQPLWPHGTTRPPSTRSRLMRMKERGLFKNG